MFSLLLFDESQVSDVDRGVILGAGLGSNASGMKKLSSSALRSDACDIVECLLFLYVVVGRVKLSLGWVSLDVRSGEGSRGRRELLRDDASFCV